MESSKPKPDAIASPATVPLDCRPARAHEVIPALRLILGSDGHIADETQAVELLKQAAHRGIDLSDLFVCEQAGWLLWAALPVPSPGKTVMIFGASHTLIPRHVAVMEQGIDGICNLFSSRQLHLAQVMLDPQDQTGIEIYQQRQFSKMAELLYLQRTVRRSAPAPVFDALTVLRNYSPQTHPLFAQAILDSYIDSQDCPALAGLRDIEDIIASHQAAGIFDPNDWFVMLRRNQPVAVLLLNQSHHSDGMELVYLGIAPNARGMGIGTRLMQLADHRAALKKIKKLSLAVDAANAPALSLYYKLGMQQVARKTAMMRNLQAK